MTSILDRTRVPIPTGPPQVPAAKSQEVITQFAREFAAMGAKPSIVEDGVRLTFPSLRKAVVASNAFKAAVDGVKLTYWYDKGYELKSVQLSNSYANGPIVTKWTEHRLASHSDRRYARIDAQRMLESMPNVDKVDVRLRTVPGGTKTDMVVYMPTNKQSAHLDRLTRRETQGFGIAVVGSKYV